MIDVGWSAISPTHMSVSAVVAAHLQRLITAGRLQVGERFPPERTIASELGVSRASVREALRELELKGLADRRPGRGTVVTGAGERPGELLVAMSSAARRRAEVVDLRQSCEPAIARNAAFRATEGDIDRMATLLAQGSADLSPARAAALDEQFHAAVAAASQNPLLVTLIELVQSWLHEYRVDSQSEREGREVSLAGHMKILQAVRARDPQSAADAMAQHIKETSRFVDDSRFRTGSHTLTNDITNEGTGDDLVQP